MWILVCFAIAALSGRVVSAAAQGSVRAEHAQDAEEGRPRRLIPIYYTPSSNYDSVLHEEYIRQQEQQLSQPLQPQQRNNYNMVASGYSYSNGDSQQFFKQYLPEAASSYQTTTFLKYASENSSPKPRPLPASAPVPLPKFKPIQAPSPSDYYLTTPSSPPSNHQHSLNDNEQNYYRQPQPPLYLRVQSTPETINLYNLVSTVQPQSYQGLGSSVQYKQQADQEQYQSSADQPQYQSSPSQAQYQSNPSQAQYQSNPDEPQNQDSFHVQSYQDSSNEPHYQNSEQHYHDNANYQQYILGLAKQQDPVRQYLPDKLGSPIQYQAQTQYQSPVAGQYQSETYPTTNGPFGSHRFASTQHTKLDTPKSNSPHVTPVTSVTIQKSQELPLKSTYVDNDDSQSFSYPKNHTKLQKVRPSNKPNYDIPAHTTESYYPYENLQPYVDNTQYANQQSKPSPFHQPQYTVTSAQPYYSNSTTPLYPSTPYPSSATPKFKQNVQIISNGDEEKGGKVPFDFLKSFQLGKDQNYEIPLTSFTGPAKDNSFSTTKKPQTSHTKANSFYDPYLKLIKSSSSKINPANLFKTQRPRPEPQTIPTEKSILPPHEEQKYREHIGTLTQILKGHQIDKALPEKVTADNIDASIDTLTTILKVLQKNPGGFRVPPAPVKHQHLPYTGSLDTALNFKTQTYHDGSTPGRPGIDYPTLTEIPETEFDCKTQRYKGFFGDPETDCQVWHYCDLNGGQASFLCPNGTIFSQQALTCDWWFNVRCNSTAQLYVLNERLYKFILPTKPTFPEDYSGPEVDEYLTAKFHESEAKRKPKDGNETVVTPGTTTEPVQSNDLSENYLRRDVSAQLSKDSTAADRVDLFLESQELPFHLSDEFMDTRNIFLARRDISSHQRDIYVNNREESDISMQLGDISGYHNTRSISYAPVRDISTQLRTWR